MQKLIFSSLIVASIVCVHPLRADQTTTPAAHQETITVESPDEDALPTGREVGKTEPDFKKAARKKRWQNVLLAVGAVALATTAIILASSNRGHKSE